MQWYWTSDRSPALCRLAGCCGSLLVLTERRCSRAGPTALTTAIGCAACHRGGVGGRRAPGPLVKLGQQGTQVFSHRVHHPGSSLPAGGAPPRLDGSIMKAPRTGCRSGPGCVDRPQEWVAATASTSISSSSRNSRLTSAAVLAGGLCVSTCSSRTLRTVPI